MKLNGTITKDGEHWLAEVPALDALTQATNRDAARAAIIAWVRDMTDRQDLPLTVEADRAGDGFTLVCTEAAPVTALLLRRRRGVG